MAVRVHGRGACSVRRAASAAGASGTSASAVARKNCLEDFQRVVVLVLLLLVGELRLIETLSLPGQSAVVVLALVDPLSSSVRVLAQLELLASAGVSVAGATVLRDGVGVPQVIGEARATGAEEVRHGGVAVEGLHLLLSGGGERLAVRADHLAVLAHGEPGAVEVHEVHELLRRSRVAIHDALVHGLHLATVRAIILLGLVLLAHLAAHAGVELTVDVRLSAGVAELLHGGVAVTQGVLLGVLRE